MYTKLVDLVILKLLLQQLAIILLLRNKVYIT